MDTGLREKNNEEIEHNAVYEFRQIVDKYVVPLFLTTSELMTENGFCNGIKNHIAWANEEHTEILIYPCYGSPQIHFKLGVAKNSSIRHAEKVLLELMPCSKYQYNNPHFPIKPYFNLPDCNRLLLCSARFHEQIFDLAYEVGLIKWLGADKVAGAHLLRLLEKIHKWSLKTYEGERMSFSFIMDVEAKGTGLVDYIDFLESSHGAVFTDGMASSIKLDNQGRIIKYMSPSDVPLKKNDEFVVFSPYHLEDFAGSCVFRPKDQTSNCIGVVSQSNGDILIFKNETLEFVKHNGRWFHVDNNRFFSTISAHLKGIVNSKEKMKVAKQIYLTILDVSFTHTGGCFAIVNDDFKQALLDDVIKHDVLDNIDTMSDSNKKNKLMTLKRLMEANGNAGRMFPVIDRKLRQELLSLDGATVIDSSGKVLTAGAIVRIDGGSNEGGRLAAAKKLSRYGFAIKISMDGQVKGFAKSNEATPPDKDTSPIEVFTLF